MTDSTDNINIMHYAYHVRYNCLKSQNVILFIQFMLTKTLIANNFLN